MTAQSYISATSSWLITMDCMLKVPGHFSCHYRKDSTRSGLNTSRRKEEAPLTWCIWLRTQSPGIRLRYPGSISITNKQVYQLIDDIMTQINSETKFRNSVINVAW